MKIKITTLLLVSSLLLGGCATATFITGRDFDASKVAQIEKGKTTGASLVALLGAPYSKTINSDGSEAWLWFYGKGSSHAQSYVFSMDVKTEMTGKRLVATLRGGVVETYSYTDGPMGGGQTAAGVGGY